MTSGEDATSRVRARIRDLKDARRFKQVNVANRLGMDPSALSLYIHGNRPLTLRVLEAIAEEAAIPLAELVAPEEGWKQVSPGEAALLRHLRKWPAALINDCLIPFFAFFADEEPAETQTRNVHEHWRRLKRTDREWVYGLLVMLREGLLPPDLRAGLDRQLAAERLREKSGDGVRRRTT